MSRSAYLSFVIILSALPCSFGFSQFLRFQHLTIDDGLPQDIVTSIAQDDRGFLWFGTEDGLCRYDGMSFVVYKHNPADSTTVASNFISSLLCDEQDHLWIGTGSGLDLLDLETESFHHISSSDGRRISANAFCRSADSGVWIGANEGLFLSSGRWIKQAFLDGSPLRHEVLGVFAEGKQIWLIDTAGLQCFGVEKESLFTKQRPPALRVLDRVLVSRVFRDKARRLWVCGGLDGIYMFDSSMVNCTHYNIDRQGNSGPFDGRVRLGIEDRGGVLWFGTMSSLERFDPREGTFTHILGESGDPSGFLGGRVYSFAIDRTGILWIGTYRGGVNIYAPARQKFEPLTSASDEDPQEAYAISQSSNGTLLVGTERGLFSMESVRHPVWIPQQGFKGDPVFAIARMMNGETWVGSYGTVGTLDRGLAGRSRIHLPVREPVRLIFQDRDSVCWLGMAEHGLYSIDRARKTVTLCEAVPDPLSFGVWSMFQDRTGQLWFGTWNAQYSFRYDKKSGNVRRYGNGPQADAFLAFPSIRAFREDPSGCLWLGSWGGGIYCLDSTYSPVEHFTELDGLASDYVKSMEIDKRGRIWVATEKGLSVFHPQTKQFTTYTQRDGLPSNFFYSGSSWNSAEGLIYLGSSRGLVVFNPDSISQNTIPPPVVITSFHVLGRNVPSSEWVPSGGFTLRHDQDFFSFEYVALDYAAPERNQYAYKLEGFDKDWIVAGTRRYAAYTHLDYGSYTFRVKASNSDGVWNTNGAAFALEVLPAFWQTWWFRLALIACLGGAAYLFYRYRLLKVLEVERLRQRIARDLHDDIGTNLSAIVLASQMANREGVPQSLREYVDDIRSVALETQSHMKDIVWMLNPKNDAIGLLLSRMKEDAARLLRDVHYSFVAPQEVSTKVDLTLRRNIFLIYKEALHNIVKHARASHVAINISLVAGMLNLEIRDNGDGFDPANVVAGNGMDSMKSRADQIGATLRIQSRKGEGTLIQLTAKIA